MSRNHDDPVDVTADNWVVALGLGLAKQGVPTEQLDRLACEVEPDGTVVARDPADGEAYVVRRMEPPFLHRMRSAAAVPWLGPGAALSVALGLGIIAILVAVALLS